MSANPSQIVIPGRGKLITPDEWRSLSPREIGPFPGLSPAAAFSLRPLSEFKASPGMRAFITEERARRILLRAGNRVGKTRHAAARVVRYALTRPNSQIRAVGVTYKASVDVIGKTLHDLIPPGALHPDSTFSPVTGWAHDLIRFKNGSSIQIRSYDQRPDAHAGIPLHLVWLDEPPPLAIFDENQSRVFDFGGTLILSCTPVGRPVPWLRKLVERGVREGTWAEFVIPFSVASCPWYTEAQVRERIAEAALIPATFSQRIEGGWEGVTEDRTFTGFDPVQGLRGRDRGRNMGAHVVDAFRLGLDHGSGENRQVALLSGVKFKSGSRRAEKVHVYREFKSGRGVMGPPEIARGIVAMIEDLAAAAGLDPMVIVGKLKAYGDSNAEGLGKTGLYNARIEEALAELGYPIRINSPVKVAGARAECEGLINALGLAGGLTVDPTCLLLVDALNHYTGAELLKDAVDALRYGLYDVLASPVKTGPKLYRA